MRGGSVWSNCDCRSDEAGRSSTWRIRQVIVSNLDAHDRSDRAAVEFAWQKECIAKGFLCKLDESLGHIARLNSCLDHATPGIDPDGQYGAARAGQLPQFARVQRYGGNWLRRT